MTAPTYLGSLSISAAAPSILANLALAVPNLEQQVGALASFSPGAIDFAADLQLAEGMLGSLKAGIAAGIQPPSINLQIGLIAALLEQLKAQLALIAEFKDLLATAGVHAYAWSGPTNQFGNDFSTELAGGFPGGAPTTPANALVLATTLGPTWSAMSQVFKVTP